MRTRKAERVCGDLRSSPSNTDRASGDDDEATAKVSKRCDAGDRPVHRKANGEATLRGDAEDGDPVECARWIPTDVSEPSVEGEEDALLGGGSLCDGLIFLPGQALVDDGVDIVAGPAEIFSQFAG